MNFGESVDYIREYMQGLYSTNKMSDGKQFPLLDSLIKKEINNKHQEFVAKVHTNLQKQQIPTVTGQATYNLDSTFYLTDFVFYNQGIDIWRVKRVEGPEELGYAQSLTALADYDVGMYDTKYQTGTITLYPTPRATGDIVTVFGRKLPADLVNDIDTFSIPANYHSKLCDFVISRLTLMCGFFDQSKFSIVQLSQKLEQDVAAAANECRKQVNFTNDNQAYVTGAYDQYMNVYNSPVVSNSPVVNYIKYINPLTFQNYSTGINGLVVASDSVEFFNDVTGASLLEVTNTSFSWLGGALWERTIVPITNNNFTYPYAGQLGYSYEMTVYADRSAPDLAQSEDVLHVSHWAADFVPDITLLSSLRKNALASYIEFTYTPAIAAAAININVTGANGGNLIINIRHSTKHS